MKRPGLHPRVVQANPTGDVDSSTRVRVRAVSRSRHPVRNRDRATAETQVGSTPLRSSYSDMPEASAEPIVVHLNCPNADAVFLIGEFNNWSTTANRMEYGGRGRWRVHLPAGTRLGAYAFFVFERGTCFGRTCDANGHSRGATSRDADAALAQRGNGNSW